MKSLCLAAVVAATLASGPALAGHGNFHAHHAGFHGGHAHVGFGVFIGPPLFWPWYYPPAYYYPPSYYYPPTYYYPPPTTIYYPPPVATPSSPTYYPQAAAPNPSGSAVIELPNNEPSQQSSPPQSSSARPQPGSVVAQGPAKQLFMYPKQGQSAEQQVRDRDECYRWAMSQVAGDPSQISGRLSQAQTSDYYRAMEACLDAHGYSVR